ncbi:MAG: autotransporter outer membrane beta-barrel domain-containing protein [Rhodomicrobium sp.]|nr:autotransporter outer membrane beta-barrel domain-containing protein [Rhodomicrobium sp.]
MTLAAGAPAIHRTGAVPLLAGETVHLRMWAEGEASGAIALVEGGETEGVLLSGPVPAEAVFTAPYDGLYGFEFRAEGPAAVTFVSICGTSRTLAAPSASPEAFTERRAVRLLGESTAQASLRRRAVKPESMDQAIKRSATLGADGEPDQVSIATSLQSLAAAEGQVFAGNKIDLWIEGRAGQFEHRLDDAGLVYDASGSAASLNLGADVLLRPDIMVGALLQLDRYSETYDALGAYHDSHGVLFGPYASIRLAPDLVFDASAAWGDTENEARLPEGTRVSFDTDRQLLRGQLSGNRTLFGLQFAPSLSLALVEDRFADPASLPEGAAGDGASVIGRLGIGTGVSYRIALEDGGFLQPNAALSTGWTLDGLEKPAFDSAAFANSAGATAEAGFTLGTADGVSIQATGGIEGIGNEDYSAWNGRISLTAPLN